MPVRLDPVPADAAACFKLLDELECADDIASIALVATNLPTIKYALRRVVRRRLEDAGITIYDAGEAIEIIRGDRVGKSARIKQQYADGMLQVDIISEDTTSLYYVDEVRRIQ